LGQDRILSANAGRLDISDLTLEESGSEPCGDGGALRLQEVMGSLRRVTVRGSDGNQAVVAFSSSLGLDEVVVEDSSGTGLQAHDSLLTIRRSVFQRNATAPRSLTDGAEHLNLSEGSAAVVSDSQFVDGGEYCKGIRSNLSDLVLRDSEVSRNGNGGMDVGGRTWLQRCRVDENTLIGAEGAGAGIEARGSLHLLDSSVSRNEVDQGTGGVRFNSWQFIAPPVFMRSTIDSNTSVMSSGGGLFLQSPALIVGCSITNNRNASRGGGVVAGVDGTIILSSTIAGNHSERDGGGLVFRGFSGTVTLSNVIFSGNSTDALGPACSGAVELLGPNLIEQDADCDLSGDLADLIVGVDPLLEPIGDFGGPTPTRPPMPGSSAIDAGSDLAPGTDPPACSEWDQRSVARPQGLRCDLGAVEICDDPTGLDTDGDGVLDACDVCPMIPDDQRDQDQDGLGDVCDPECGDEPSALDQRPLAQPLRVAKNPERLRSPWFMEGDPEWLTVSWEANEPESDHELVIGTLEALREGRYDHAGFGACGLPAGELDIHEPRVDSYFLVVGRCGSTLSSPGRDSEGGQRPEAIDPCR
jgi:hypothetical protein